jgi:hypothetical protein
MQVTITGVDGASGLDGLAASLDRAARVAPVEARKVVQVGAFNIKRDWRAAWSGLAHAPSLANAVTYDTTLTASGATAEIGPDKSRPQGALGNLLEFGSVNNAPRPGGAPALEAEQPRFERALEQIALNALDAL